MISIYRNQGGAWTKAELKKKKKPQLKAFHRRPEFVLEDNVYSVAAALAYCRLCAWEINHTYDHIPLENLYHDEDGDTALWNRCFVMQTYRGMRYRQKTV